MNNKIVFICFLVTLLSSCREDYDIPINSTAQDVLVVEGSLINNGQTIISLTNTFKLDDTARIRPVLNAQLTVEGKDNSVAPLVSAGNGRYSANLNLLANQEYRLRIRTTNGKEYLSDYVPVNNTPPIDSLNWKERNGGVIIYANTHDVNNDTWYYRWDFEETWQINSNYYSLYKFSNGAIVPRNMVNDDVSVCWKSDPSTNIILGSSAQLQSDMIFESPVVFIPPASEKLSVRYSILVKQYAIEKKAYEYFQLMKKNTESLGTIFDPQPSEMRGNIHCISNPNEPVVGYLTASDVHEKRMFISVAQLSAWNFSLSCYYLEIPNHNDSIKNNVPVPYYPWEANWAPTGTQIMSYFVAPPNCVDCTTRGGSTTKPVFW